MKRKTSRRGIEDLGDGWYRIRVRVTDPRTGRTIERDRKMYCRTITDAAREQGKLRQEVQAPASTPQRLKLGAHAADWLTRRTEAKRPDGTPRRAPTTISWYTHLVNKWIVPALGDYWVDSIAARDIEDWRDFLGESKSATTVNGAINVLRMVLRDGGSTVADRVAHLEADDTRITDDEPNALDSDEIERFLRAARTVRNGRHFALILVLMTTATRVGTALALRWEDIDPEKGEIHFRRRLSKGLVLPGVKRSRKSKDSVSLLPEVWAALEAHRARFNARQAAGGLVFPAFDGGHHDRGVLRKAFARLVRAAGITKRFTPHGCRYTAAAIYRRMAGSAVSMSIAGHTTERMHRKYAQVSMDEKHTAAREGFGGALRVIDGGSEKRGIKRGIRKRVSSK